MPLILLILLALASMGCDLDGGRKQLADEEAQAALATLRDAGEALSAAQEDVFRPTAEQAEYLESFTAWNDSGTVNGYFVNQDGVAGYFHGYDRPFNFIWTGGTVEMTAFDGLAYKVMDGSGELLLKCHDDALLLQRYKGEFKAGVWDGYGELWSRNREAGGHNYFYYKGGFAADCMAGRGVYLNYNLNGKGEPPYKYEGDMWADRFHGQGTLTDLATGEMAYKGLWLEARRFRGSLGDWRKGDKWNELNHVERQYRDVFMTGDLEAGGFINITPGEGALTVIWPEAFENVAVVDHSGRFYEPEPVSRPEAQGPGVVLDAPLSGYPLTLTMSYDLRAARHHFQFTAKRPFGLILNDRGLEREGLFAQEWPAQESLPQDDDLEEKIKERLRELESK